MALFAPAVALGQDWEGQVGALLEVDDTSWFQPARCTEFVHGLLMEVGGKGRIKKDDVVAGGAFTELHDVALPDVGVRFAPFSQQNAQAFAGYGAGVSKEDAGSTA